jgi:hypothetical protein
MQSARHACTPVFRVTRVLDFRRVSDLILRFSDNRQPDLVLSQGVHAIGRDAEGLPGPVQNAPAALAQFCVDRRGVWLRLQEGAQGVHVNGRPVRRMAMLRAGDSVYLDGVELLLLGREPGSASDGVPGGPNSVLRAVGGPNHGRCFGLEQPVALVRQADGGLFVGDAGGDVRARLRPRADGVDLQLIGDAACQVNGWPVRGGLLRPCDQLVLDAQHRFVIEAPMCALPDTGGHAPDADAIDDEIADGAGSGDGIKASARRVPWLLLAALLLSASLALLLLYGAR